jgi:hypothetical protein
VKGAGAVAALREELLALPGVAEVEVEGDGASPSVVRVRLAPEADPEQVGGEVQRLLAGLGMRSRVDAGAAPLVAPGHPLNAAEASHGGTALKSVRLEESGSSVEVTVTATDGRQVARSVGEGEEDLAVAVIEAVGILLEGTPPRVVAVDWTAADGSRVVTVVLESSGGRRGAGAGIVRVSAAYAVARAAWSALGY